MHPQQGEIGNPPPFNENRYKCTRIIDRRDDEEENESENESESGSENENESDDTLMPPNMRSKKVYSKS